MAVLIFEILLNGTAMFNHGNIKIHLQVDKVIRGFLVTPDMHRTHHSIYLIETNSNYGFCLSIWDRLMGTYREQPKEGHEGMTIGLEAFRNARYLHLYWLLLQPFVDAKRHET